MYNNWSKISQIKNQKLHVSHIFVPGISERTVGGSCAAPLMERGEKMWVVECCVRRPAADKCRGGGRQGRDGGRRLFSLLEQQVLFETRLGVYGAEAA